MAKRSARKRSVRARADELVTKLHEVQRWTVLVLVALVPMLFWRTGADPFILPKATAVWVGAAVLLGCWIAVSIRTARIEVPSGALTTAMALFAAAAVVTTLVSTTPALAFYGEFERNAGLLSYLSYIVVAITVLVRFDRADVRRAMCAMVLGAVVPATYALLQELDADPWEWTEYGFADVFSSFGNANLLSGYVAIIAPLALWLVLTARTVLARVGSGAVLLAVLLAAVFSSSIQGPIAAGAGCVVVGLVWLRTTLFASREFGRRWLIGALTVVIIAGAIALAGPLRSEVDDGMGERKYFWPAARDVFLDHPVAGTGLDTFGQSFLRERPRDHAAEFGDSVADSAHNVPLGMFSGGGLLLGLSYLSIVAVSGWVLVSALRRTDDALLVGGLGGSWVAYQLQSAVSMDVPSVGLLHFVLAAGLWIAHRGTSNRTFGAPATSGTRRPGVIGPVIGAVVAMVLVVLAVQPLRADLAAGDGFRTAAGGDVATGLERLEQATDLAPWRSRYWLLRTAVLEEIRQYPAALETAVEAAKREPGSSEYAVFAARLANQVGDLSDAGLWYRRAVRRNPWSRPVVNEAVIWADVNRPSWRLEMARRFTRVAPSDPTAWIYLARASNSAGDRRTAKSAYERALELNPNDQEAREALNGPAAG